LAVPSPKALEAAAPVAGRAVALEQAVARVQAAQERAAPVLAVQVLARVVPVRVARAPEEEASIIRKSEVRAHPALRE
jgi:hypothetical protein